jgi:hypothetical protein
LERVDGWMDMRMGGLVDMWDVGGNEVKSNREKTIREMGT